jgi:hypothetical protein
MCFFKQFAELTNNITSIINFSIINTTLAISAYNIVLAAFSAINITLAVPAYSKALVTASSVINAALAAPTYNKVLAAAVPLLTASLLDIYSVYKDFFKANNTDALGKIEEKVHN